MAAAFVLLSTVAARSGYAKNAKGRIDSGNTLGNSTHVTIPSIACEDPSVTLISTRAPPTPLSSCQDMRPPVLLKAHGGLFI
jgi:hypothetical protein